MLFSTLWAYWTPIKTSTGFTPLQLVYGIEAIHPIECEIPSLKLEIEILPNKSKLKQHLFYLEKLEKTQRCGN